MAMADFRSRLSGRARLYICRLVRRAVLAYLALAVCLLWASSCGSENTHMGPSEDEAAALVQALAFTFQKGIIAALAGEGTIGGVVGELRVKGMQWDFDRYSPDGELFIDGELVVDPAQQPMAMRGDLGLSGSLSGVLTIDLVYSLSTGVFHGVISVDGVSVPLSERLCCMN